MNPSTLSVSGRSKCNFSESCESKSMTGTYQGELCHEMFSLHYFQSALFASILEDTIVQLRILAECNNELRIHKARADMEQLLADKFSVARPASTDELDGIDVLRLYKDEYKLDKMRKDRNYVKETLVALYLDLSMYRSFRELCERNNLIITRDDHRTFLVEDEARNKIARRELAKQLRQQRNHIKTVNYDTDMVIDGLKTQVEDAALKAEVRTRYTVRWQGARAEQHAAALRDREAPPLAGILRHKRQLDHEQRAHAEIELLTNIAINETLAKVEGWMNKYDKDMEAVELKIQIMKNHYEVTQEERYELEKTYAKHEQLMKDWNHFKEEREKARQYRDKMARAAVSAQAWWRGMMVRLQLGPYKPAKRPAKGDKKKK